MSAAGHVVRDLVPADHSRWDAFVHAHPRGTFFHLSGWQEAVTRGFGHQCLYLLTERAGEIRGVLPLVWIRSRLFGHALVSVGFGVGGGPLALDAAAENSLLDAAEARAGALGARHIELRGPPPERPGWVASTGLYYGFRKPLDPDPERNLASLRRKQRAMVRKALGLGLRSELDDDTSRLWKIYAASVHRLGTPVFGRRWFAALKAAFGPNCEILTILRDATPIASVMSFYFKDQVLPYYGGSLPVGRELAANDIMYHEVMRRAVTVHGSRLFDFGRSKAGTGAFEFKRHWGFEPTPLTYGFWLPRGGPLPAINPLNPKYRVFVDLWRRQPLWLSKVIGPAIARDLG